MEVLTLPAPAKLNLFLHVLGRRADGYHNLQTAFQFIDLADTLRFETLPHSDIQLNGGPPGLADADNLIIKAANALKQATGCRQGAKIQLQKKLPMGAGIGGGSSNAATTLAGLNKIWNTGLTLQELSVIGLKLGADVPIFLHGRAAWAEGIGEKLAPICPPQPWYLVLVPDCHVSTADIFCDEELTRGTPAIKIPAFFTVENPNNLEKFQQSGLKNDCQALVSALFPPVKEALDWLGQQQKARMTGTGACVFAAFEAKDEAEALARLCPSHIGTFVAKGRNCSPLHTALDPASDQPKSK